MKSNKSIYIFLWVVSLFNSFCAPQTSNSNSNDRPVNSDSQSSGSSSGSSSGASSSGGSSSGSGQDTNVFRPAALKIIRSHCFECHGAWASYKTDSDWISSGLVLSGDAQNSTLIEMLINAGGSMPQNGNALSNADYQTLQDWINAMSSGS